MIGTTTTRLTRNAAETRQLGRELGGSLHAGDLVLLYGDLGAGKTTLTKGIGEALGVGDEIQSPTFTVVAEYPAPGLGVGGWLVHVDLYRLGGDANLASIGIDELLDREDAVMVVEWPERIDRQVSARLSLQMEQLGDERLISVVDLRPATCR